VLWFCDVALGCVICVVELYSGIGKWNRNCEMDLWLNGTVLRMNVIVVVALEYDCCGRIKWNLNDRTGRSQRYPTRNTGCD